MTDVAWSLAHLVNMYKHGHDCKRRASLSLFSDAHTLNSAHLPTMLAQVTKLSTSITIDKAELALITTACEMLSKGSVTVDDLWPGRLHEQSSYVLPQMYANLTSHTI